MYKHRVVSWTTWSWSRILYSLKNLMGLDWWLLHSYLLCNTARLICCSTAKFVVGMLSTGLHFYLNRNLRNTFAEMHWLEILYKETINCSIHSKSSWLIQKATGSLVEVKTNYVWRPAYVAGSCMLAKTGSDLRRKGKNKKHTHVLFETASESISPDARRSPLVYRNGELSDHPEHEAFIFLLPRPWVMLAL